MTTSIQLARALLSQAAAVTSVVSDRIYIGQIPQGASAPCLVLRSVWSEPEYQVAGVSPARNSRVRVECIGKSASAVDLLAEFVGAALRDVAHQSVSADGDPLSDSVTIWQLGTHESDVGDDRTYHRVTLEFRMRWLQ
ncbi:Protein of unknown function [Rhizobium sp. RU35A]|uniref:tail completion protein gp17 n=1 Tax=Rhizobium sp. RU35A TaxID=1907414 RepID=UPI0009544153|nr:DUF3168 domain-containing protein [Rhizobium sp. RU35A]SIQ98769.1 Protein of unknown function [Rhizobium sp. RU35A]